jgi:UDP-glucose 4-epimerase
VVCLRLTNTYGPRQRIIDANQNFLGLWIGRVLRGEPFEVWGGGQLRDLAHVDDIVAAFIAAADCEACNGKILNVGGSAPITLSALAEEMKVLTGASYTVRSFPRENSLIDVGSYYSDDSEFRRLTGWSSERTLISGLSDTLEWFRPRLDIYTGPRSNVRSS